tara:strand:+ start:3535 stop:3669 length:135 start_codon:yes stop_codon:yes gene_type:complete
MIAIALAVIAITVVEFWSVLLPTALCSLPAVTGFMNWNSNKLDY